MSKTVPVAPKNYWVLLKFTIKNKIIKKTPSKQGLTQARVYQAMNKTI